MATFVLRLWLPDRPGALGAVASRVGAVGGDLVGIDILERGAGRAIDELVDGPARAAFEDVDAHEITTDRADPARHGTERAGAVGQPQTEDEGGHGRARYGWAVNSMFRACERQAKTRVATPVS